MIVNGDNGSYYEVTDPVGFPKASGFLWNEKMMAHVNCRGYIVSQFMQPEQGYFTEHPGRFVFVKDEETGKAFSTPHEPMRIKSDIYRFIVEKHQLRWINRYNDIEIRMTFSLPHDEAKELWTVQVINHSDHLRKICRRRWFV